MFLFMQPKQRVRKRNEEAQEVLDKIESYLDSNIKEPAQILVRFWGAQTAVLTYQEIRKIIIAEELPQQLIAQWQQDYSKLVNTHLKKTWMQAAAKGAADNSNLTAAGYSFDNAQKNVLEWIDKHGAQFVTRTTKEQKEAIRVFLARGVQESMGTDELARLIRPCVGLTRPQVQANVKLYQNMKETLKKEHPKMKESNIEKKAREAAAKYAEKQHRKRATDIARTEMATAYNQGVDMGIRQAQEAGVMGHMKKVWCTSGDRRVCPLCQSLEGTEVEMEDEFVPKQKGSMFAHTMIPPAHPRCACAVMYVEV